MTRPARARAWVLVVALCGGGGLAASGLAGCDAIGPQSSCSDPDFCPEGEVCVLTDGDVPACVTPEDPLGPRPCDDDDDCDEGEVCVERVTGERGCVYRSPDAGS